MGCPRCFCFASLCFAIFVRIRLFLFQACRSLSSSTVVCGGHKTPTHPILVPFIFQPSCPDSARVILRYNASKDNIPLPLIQGCTMRGVDVQTSEGLARCATLPPQGEARVRPPAFSSSANRSPPSPNIKTPVCIDVPLTNRLSTYQLSPCLVLYRHTSKCVCCNTFHRIPNKDMHARLLLPTYK